MLYDDGRIACSFQRPSIAANDRFDAGGLSYSVIEPLKSVSMRYDGELILVEDKRELMRELGRKQLTLHLHSPVDAIPATLAPYGLTIAADGGSLQSCH